MSTHKTKICIVLTVFIIAFSMVISLSYAQVGECTSCDSCKQCPENITKNHDKIRDHIKTEFEEHRTWMVEGYFLSHIGRALMRMTSQLTATGMQQIQMIGSFFDAKHQLETQRLFQTMTAQAHKDYHPSESMCKIGTNMLSLGSSEKKSALVHQTLARGMMQRQLLSGENLSGVGADVSDRASRAKMMLSKFCNKNDGGVDTKDNPALEKLCKNTSSAQMNMDVDYTNAIENKLTLQVDFTEEGSAKTTDEENIFALGANLFASEVLPYIPGELLTRESGDDYDFSNFYLRVRGIAAKRSVAQNSYSAITAMRGEGNKDVAPFLKAILKEAGIEQKEIEMRLGEKPSYFAQMEVLTKDIYQDPAFYANLYDKPVNVERKSAALLAIEIMQDRDMYKSLLRSEAVLATLVEVMLSKEHDRISGDIKNVGEGRERMILNRGGR